MDSERPSFLIELGDFKDQGPDKASTIEYLDRVEAVFSRFSGPSYHVLGNHDLDLIGKPEFLARIKNYGQDEAQAHYSFEVSGIKFIVLDACYNSKLEDYVPGNWDWTDANVPPDQLAWLSLFSGRLRRVRRQGLRRPPLRALPSLCRGGVRGDGARVRDVWEAARGGVSARGASGLVSGRVPCRRAVRPSPWCRA